MSSDRIAEHEILDKINKAWERMSLPQRRFWEVIRVDPVKWIYPGYGESEGGFWVVAIMGRSVVWYDDIEGHFLYSDYKAFGTFGEHKSGGDSLEEIVNSFLHQATKVC